MKFKCDLLLTDPMYLMKKDSENDWDIALSEGYDHAALHLLGIRKYISAEAGEDVRNVLNEDGEKIGGFCSDSALICVCDLKQALSYNPDFLDDYAQYPNCFCVIRGFDGEISAVRDEEDNVNFVGTGKNGFKTVVA